MTRNEVIEILKSHADEIRDLGAESLYLYGSVARDEAKPSSDVDLFIDRNFKKKFGLIELARLQLRLQELLGTNVDVGTRTSLHPLLKSDIEQSSIRVL